MRSVRPSTIRSACAVIALAVISSVSFAQGAADNPHLRLSQSYNWTFSEIGDVGNAPYVVDNGIGVPPRVFGGVNHRYRIATTEVTWGQYYEFLQAYAPHTKLDGSLAPPGGPIRYLGSIEGVPQYELRQPERANQPAYQSWRIWARVCNWLNAGGPDLTNPTSADFENGAYDTSTFNRVQGPNGNFYFTDQDEHTPGARYWIPSYHELAKATFYDPNKDGEGNGEYWQYGHSSDNPPIPGDPALGGETNAGWDDEYPAGQFRPFDVGSYPTVLSPWGLLDTTGGVAEMTETWEDEDPFRQTSRYVLPAAGERPILLSNIEEFWETGPIGPLFGLRLAATVPAPPSAIPLTFLLAASARRRRR